jgi:ketosteroid isomerase-like protein
LQFDVFLSQFLAPGYSIARTKAANVARELRMSRSNKETVLAFIDRINAHDVQGIIDLMADDYQFVSSSGDRFRDLEFMRQTWQAQFTDHPDFTIRVQRVIADTEGVAVFGWSEGTYSPDGTQREENHWEVPVAFLGLARDGKIVYWEVFSDTSIVFDIIKSRQAEVGK